MHSDSVTFPTVMVFKSASERVSEFYWRDAAPLVGARGQWWTCRSKICWTDRGRHVAFTCISCRCVVSLPSAQQCFLLGWRWACGSKQSCQDALTQSNRATTSFQSFPLICHQSVHCLCCQLWLLLGFEILHCPLLAGSVQLLYN